MTVRLLTALLSCAVLLAGCVQPQPPPPPEGRRVTASAYPWIVQDQGNTVRLADGRTLWIFADTAQTESRTRFFVTSSAAVAQTGSLSLRYLTGRGGVPAEFLPRTAAEKADRKEGKSYVAVWPTGATTLPDGRVLIAYAKYRAISDPLRFDFLGGGLYTYRYPGTGAPVEDAPVARRLAELWTPGDGPIASPVAVGDLVYFTQCEDDRCYSLRVPADRVGERGQYLWWTGAGWDHRKSARKPMTYGSDRPGRNPPTTYLPRSKVFATVDTSGGIQSDNGLIWVARQPWGPWSPAARFRLPDCTLQDGCYTLNPHPADSPPGRLRVSYATAHDGPYVHVVDVPITLSGTGAVPRVSVP